MKDISNIFEKIDTYGDEVISLQKELTKRVALGPSNGGTGEHEKAEFVNQLVQTLSPDRLEEIKSPDERAYQGYRPNLIARWNSDAGAQTLWILSHLDVVPPGDPGLWTGDPYEVRVDGDRIVGRGVEDNQHGIISSWLALKAILESGQRIKRSVGLAFVADEESGSRYGLQYVLSHHKDIFYEEDLIIVPDGGNEEGTMIEVAEKAMLWLKFVVVGHQCHASTPDKGQNSLVGAAGLILALEELKEKFAFINDLYRPPASTFSPTKIEANVPNVNTIPGRDVFYMDCRILPDYRVDEIITAARKIASNIENKYDLKITVEVHHREDAAKPTAADAPIVKVLSSAIRYVTGKAAGPVGIGGGTVAAFFRKAGFPAAVWCTQSDTAHQPDEYALISNIITDAKIFAYLYMGEDKVTPFSHK